MSRKMGRFSLPHPRQIAYRPHPDTIWNHLRPSVIVPTFPFLPDGASRLALTLTACYSVGGGYYERFVQYSGTRGNDVY